MGVGMSINFGLMRDEGLLIASLVLGLLSIKAVLIWGLCRLMRVGGETSVRVSLLLSQSGEFGFVIFGLALVTGVMETDLFEKLLLVIALTMVMTPLMTFLSERLGRRFKSGQHPHDVDNVVLDTEERHVIITGFGRVGRRVAKILRAGKMPYVALDCDPDMVDQGHVDGFNVFYGDASRPEVIFASFGDMLRVPGSEKDLFMVKSAGGDVRIVYSPLEALTIARDNPDKEVVFFAVGFETTTPGNAMAV